MKLVLLPFFVKGEKKENFSKRKMSYTSLHSLNLLSFGKVGDSFIFSEFFANF